jgi:hypothetical protein
MIHMKNNLKFFKKVLYSGYKSISKIQRTSNKSEDFKMLEINEIIYPC